MVQIVPESHDQGGGLGFLIFGADRRGKNYTLTARIYSLWLKILLGGYTYLTAIRTVY